MLGWDIAEPFDMPVLEKWTLDQLPGYFDEIKKPMDFRTIKETLQTRAGYRNKRTNLFDFRLYLEDVYCVIDNCITYNREGTELAETAKKIEKGIHKEMKDMPLPTEKKNGSGSKRDPSSSHDEHEEDIEDDGEEDGDAGSEEELRDGETKAEPKEEKVSAVPRRTKKEREKKGQKVKAERLKVADDEDMDGKEGAENDSDDTGDKKLQASKKESKLDGEADDLSAAKREYEELRQRRKKLRAEVDEIDAKRTEKMENMTDSELTELRDMIENSRYSENERVVKILHQAVADAIEKGEEKDPETITVQLDQIDPRLLMLVHYVYYPDPKREESVKQMRKLADRMTKAKKQVKNLKRPLSSSAGEGDSKRAKNRR